MAAKKKVVNAKTSSKALVARDFEGRTCIQVDRSEEFVWYIPLDVTNGLNVMQVSVDYFDRRYKPMDDYPVERAAQLYAEYGRDIGASKEALDYLGKFTKIVEKDYEMANSKRKEATTTVKTTPAKAAKATPAKAAKATPAKATPAKATPAKAKAVKGDGTYTSAAQMFKELIISGELTDDKIFEQVKAQFGLDDSKRSYVAWYRNNLRKKGVKVPDGK